MVCHRNLFSVGLLALIHLVVLGAAKEVEVEFKIVPNKAGKVEVALDTPPIPSSTCRFEWDSSGATVEVRSALRFLCCRFRWAILSLAEDPSSSTSY